MPVLVVVFCGMSYERDKFHHPSQWFRRMYLIHFLNRAHAPLSVEEGQTILDAALDAEIPIRFGCLYGDCTACISQLLSGDVERGQETGLTETQRTAGFVLLCVARPRSDCQIWVGEDKAGEIPAS